MFDKFLAKPDDAQAEPPQKRKAGRPPLPDHLRKRPKRSGERFDENKRVKKEFRKNKSVAGRRHWKAKAKTKRLRQKRIRLLTNYRHHRKYQASLRRKYLQHQSVSRLRAVRRAAREGKEIDIGQSYALTYAEWVVMLVMAEDVFHPEKGLLTAVEACGNPVRWKNVTYVDRLDRTKAFVKENMAIFWNGKPLDVKH
jgi:hypothetical protein